MAIAFLRGTMTRDPYFKAGDNTAFAACSIKETYTDRSGEERLGGYHDIVAFGDDAQQLALYSEGDQLDVKASIRYRADNRFVHINDSDKNPFTAQFVVMEFLSGGPSEAADEEDPFAGA